MRGAPSDTPDGGEGPLVQTSAIKRSSTKHQVYKIYVTVCTCIFGLVAIIIPGTLIYSISNICHEQWHASKCFHDYAFNTACIATCDKLFNKSVFLSSDVPPTKALKKDAPCAAG